MEFNPFESLAGVSLDLGGGASDAAQTVTPQKISLSKIKPDPLQPRKIFVQEEIDGLAASISSLGLIQPLIIRTDPNDENGFLIIAGERRFRACTQLNLSEVPAIVRDDVDEKTIRYMQIIENLQREDLTEDVIAQFVCDRCAANDRQVDIAESLGISQARVSEYAQWLDIPEDIKEAVKIGKIKSIHIAVLMYRLWKNGQAEDCKKLLSQDVVRRSDIYALQHQDQDEQQEEVSSDDDSSTGEEHESSETFNLDNVDSYDTNEEDEEEGQSSQIKPSSSTWSDSDDESFNDDDGSDETETDEDEQPYQDEGEDEDEGEGEIPPELKVSILCEYAGESVIVRYDLASKPGHFWVETQEGESIEAEAKDLLLRSIANV